MKRVVLATLAVMILCVNNSFSQTGFPDTLWVPVTFYDFRSNGSNPEFEQNIYNGRRTGMVQKTLDAERKPVSTTITDSINRSAYLKYWFRPWKDAFTNDSSRAEGDFTVPSYVDNGDERYGAYLGPVAATTDQAFVNVVINDSLPFIHSPQLGNGVYVYDSTNFFPLDNRGFGNEGKSHNYSFTMELHWKFEMRNNLTFDFRGDDDVWAFINNNLVMDLGGRHGPESGSFNLNSSGLTVGQQYDLDFFFAERHTTGSNIRITTNIISAKPAGLKLYPSATTPDNAPFVNPNLTADTVAAGDSIPIFSRIFDQNGLRMPEFDSPTAPVTWEMQELVTGTVRPTGTLSRTTGNMTYFRPTRAYNTVYIIATFNNDDGLVMKDTIRLYTTAGRAHHLTIQTFDTLNYRDTSTQIDQKLLRFEAADTDKKVYPVVRDRYENIISFATNASWRSLDTTIVKAGATTVIAKGEGLITRKTDSTKTTKAITTYTSGSTTLHDTIEVNITTITYDSLRIYIVDNGKKYIDTITIATDASQTLRVEGRRSDGRGWDDIPSDWSTSAGLPVTGSPPQNSITWSVIPTNVATGKIFVNRAGATGDSVVAIFTPGQPKTMALYKKEGTPTAADAWSIPPVIDTIVAGTSYNFVAKIFDRNGYWLSRYENAAVSKPLISWAITNRNGPGAPLDTLSGNSGHIISFKPTHAFNRLTITATFKDGTTSFTSSVNLYVIAGAATHLVIEANAQPTGENLVKDSPIDTVVFGSRDTTKYVYAILRDANQNFVSQSRSTDWSSTRTTLVSATEANALAGEGKLLRGTESSGSASVTATSKTNPSFTDNVAVKIIDYTFDALRILVNNDPAVTNLQIKLGRDTLLQVEGLRSTDNTWVPVDASWLAVVNGRITNGPIFREWPYAPTDTGKGLITVSLGTAVPDTLSVTVVPNDANYLSIYNKTGPEKASGTFAYVSLPDSVTVSADSTLPLVAKIFDINKIWLSQYETDASKSATIQWKIVENSGHINSGTLNANAGHSVVFTPDSAHRNVLVVASIAISPTLTSSDTVKIHINAGAPKKLFIEPSANWQSSPNRPNPVDTIKIQDSVTTANGYAILRDVKNNFASYSTSTAWNVLDNDTIITIRNGVTVVGEGIVERKAKTGLARISAFDNTYSLRDSTYVKLLEYYYRALRIVVGNDTGLKQLTINTNQDTTLRVQGLRSDTTIWEYIDNGTWSNTPSLDKSIKTPGTAATWRLSPTDTATGAVMVSMPTDPRTIPDTLDVTFIPGPPVSVTIEIVTPADSLIAGETINAVVKIHNLDGIVPGKYCFDAKDVKYTDVIPQGGNSRPKPYVLIGVDTLFLSENWTDATKEQCFYGGVDTIDLKLFYATTTRDSMHAITVSLGSLQGITAPFTLLPNKIDTILVYRDNKPITKLDITYEEKDVRLVAIGFDKYGNLRGAETSNWKIDSILPSIRNPNRVTQIFYDATSAKESINGGLVVHSTTDTSATGKLSINITGPLNKIESAITRDNNGNGLLDGVDLVFTRPVILPKDVSLAGFTIFGPDGSVYTVDSIRTDSNKADSIWHVFLKEIVTTTPQTNCTLTVMVDPIDSLLIAGTGSKVLSTEDGAGPVVWYVEKKIVDLDDRTRDIVTVTFSEDVVRVSDNQRLGATDTLTKIFTVWQLDPTGKLVVVDSMLVGINSIKVLNNRQVQFITSNGVDISGKNYFSITGTTPYIKDAADLKNPPVVINKQTVVTILAVANPPLVPVPNPSKPIFTRVEAGKFTLVDQPDATTWVKNDRSGVALTFTIAVPQQSENVQIRCKAKIHDFVGNLVTSAVNDDIIPSIVKNSYSTTYPVQFYWNMSNSKKMPCAPGVYKIQLAVEFYTTDGKPVPSKYKDFKMEEIIGIGR
ncbi:MAG: fibro-slime domain-containing protein [Fibrobacter sp.]|nr:fibro-slime domain-containing protein [Fibrobacter sp.]